MATKHIGILPSDEADKLYAYPTLSGNGAEILHGDGKWSVEATAAVTGVKGNTEDSYRQGNVNITPANIGAATADHNHDTSYASVNHTHTAADVGAATADHNHDASYAAKSHSHAAADLSTAVPVSLGGTGATTAANALSNLGAQAAGNYAAASHSHDAATTVAGGFMSKDDKIKLNGIAAGAQVNSVTGIKGNAESSYRTGNVNITPANIGAQVAGNYSSTTHTHAATALTSAVPVSLGGTGQTTAAAARNALGLGNTTGALPIANGGTGATTAALARASLGAAAASHGNHVPTTQTANNAIFLRNDNTWQTVTPANIGAAASSHTHNYAGSSSAGGSATTALKTQNTATGSNAVDLVYATVADNDYIRIRAGGTASNAGYIEIATADDAAEPIYVRQYSGVFTTLQRTATILDASGNTTFPGKVTASSFAGNIAGNATNVTGTVAIANGGTGQTTAAAARNALGLGNTTGALPIANGGTGATTAALARASLGAAAASHGNHVPTTQTANNAVFLRNDNTWQTVTPANIGAAASSHTHAATALTSAVPVSLGGTGQTTAAAARNAFGLGNTTGALPIANGGTGQTTAALARNALGLGNTTGALPIANGGTGLSASPSMLTNLASTSAANVLQASPRPGVTGTLPIANGGTGQSSRADARNTFCIPVGTATVSSAGSLNVNISDYSQADGTIIAVTLPDVKMNGSGGINLNSEGSNRIIYRGDQSSPAYIPLATLPNTTHLLLRNGGKWNIIGDQHPFLTQSYTSSTALVTDLNDFKYVGFWQITNTDGAFKNTPTGMGTKQNFYLRVSSNTAGTRVIQEIWGMNKNYYAFRFYAGSWQPWQKVTTTADTNVT